MIMIKPYRFFTIMILTLLGLGFALNISQSLKTTHNLEDFDQFFPDAQTFHKSKSNVPIYEVISTENSIVGYIFYTLDLAPNISGYGGAPIEMLIGIDQHDKIIKINLIRHQETPSFISEIDHFFNRITEINIETPLELGKNIDGMTSATITNLAIIETINKSIQKISPILGKDIAQLKSFQNHRRKMLKMLIVVLILFFLSGTASITRKKLIHWISLTSGFLVLGFIFKEMISTSHIAGLVSSQNPSWNQSPLLHFLILGTLISSIFLGRIYCSGVCPFAFVEEILHQINRKFFKHILSPNEKTDAICRWIKYVFLIILLASCFILHKSSIGAAEVYVTLFFGIGSWAAGALLIIVVFASFFYQRFWCRYLCPCGAFLALIAQLKRYKNLKNGAPSGDYGLCADAAECFYCSKCFRADLSKSTKKQNLFFIGLIILSTAAFIFSFSHTINSTQTQTLQIEKTIAPVITQAYSTSEEAKIKLKEYGITPHPAKYWKEIEQD